MKILFISAGDYKYGAPRSMFELMIGLKEKYGVTPVLLTKKHNELNEKCNKLGIENYSFWYPDIMAGAQYKNVLLRFSKHALKYTLFILSRFHRKPNLFRDVDLIHTNLNRIGIGAWYSQKYNVPHVWHLREFGKEDYNVIFYKHNCIDYMRNHADRFIAISKSVKNVWTRMGLDPNQIEVIYNFLDLARFKQRKRDFTDNSIKIVMTGHIQPGKGQIQLIKALHYLPEYVKCNLKIDFYGEAYNEYLRLLKKEIELANASKIVSFKGYSPAIAEILQDYDIGVTASKAEAFGRITVEYMAAKLIVIASDTGANPEIIHNGQTGLLYEYDNSKDLASKILWVFEHKSEANLIAQKAVDHAYNTFSYNSNIIEQVYNLYCDILKRKSEEKNAISSF